MSELIRSNNNSCEKKKGIVVMVEKLQRRLFLAKNVLGNVKEGHFAVIAVDDYEERRFIVPVTYLKHPSFIILLERAAEEYGFNHEGAVVIPCRPTDLKGLLADQQTQEKIGSCKALFTITNSFRP